MDTLYKKHFEKNNLSNIIKKPKNSNLAIQILFLGFYINIKNVFKFIY